MRSEDVSFFSEGNTIRGTIDHAIEGLPPSVMFLHGGGSATRHRTKYIAEALALAGISSFRFDFSGHGESTGRLNESSLSKRLQEANSALEQYFDQNLDRGVTLIASSMGAHIAARLCKRVRVNSLVLFCPAAYAADAEDVLFNEDFSKILRKKDSYQNSLAFDDVGNLDGNILIFYGTADNVVPRDVVQTYISSAVNARSKILFEIKDAPHLLHGWLDKNIAVRTNVNGFICSIAS